MIYRYLIIHYLIIIQTYIIYCKKLPNEIIKLKPFGNHKIANDKIDSFYEFLDPNLFYNKYVLPGKPVVFKGAAKHIPAYILWTDTYIREKFGTIKISLEHGKKENRGTETLSLLLSEFINKYNSTLEDYYMIQEVVGNMIDDICLSRPFQCGGYDFKMAVLWLSSGGTISVLHYDDLENINCLLDGYKDIVFIDKKYAEKVEAKGWTFKGSYHTDDIDAFDPHKYPELASVPIITARINKGDCIYIPIRWYHVVRSSKGRNLACNLWFQPILYYNASKCSYVNENGVQVNADTDNYNLKKCEPLTKLTNDISNNNKQIKYKLFEKFKGEEYINKSEILKLWMNNNKYRMNNLQVQKLFSSFDVEKNDILSWNEIEHWNFEEYLLENYEFMESVNQMSNPEYENNKEEPAVKEEL